MDLRSVLVSRSWCFVFCAFTLQGASGPTPPPSQDTAWKRHIDREAGFCIEYPKKWSRQTLADGAGFALTAGIKHFALPTGEIYITTSPSQDDPVYLVEAHFEGLKKFQRASDMQILERREITLAGIPALYTKDRYRDPLENAEWIEELVLARHKDTLYRLAMVCRADQISRFEFMFKRFVKSMQLDCNEKH